MIVTPHRIEGQHDVTLGPRRPSPQLSDALGGQLRLAAPQAKACEEEPPIVGGVQPYGAHGCSHRCVEISRQLVSAPDVDLEIRPAISG